MGRRLRSQLPKEGVWFVTSSTKGFVPVFKDPNVALVVENELVRYLPRHDIKLFEYVIMHHHIHMILETTDTGGSLSNFMRDFKRSVSLSLKDHWEGSTGLWMDRFDDLLIIEEETLKTKIRYILNNPNKSGLVNAPEGFRFSSAWVRANPGETGITLSPYSDLGFS